MDTGASRFSRSTLIATFARRWSMRRARGARLAAARGVELDGVVIGLLLIQMMVPNLVPYFARLFDGGVEVMGRVAAALGAGR